MTFGESIYGEAPFGESGESTPQGSLAISIPKPTLALSGGYRDTGSFNLQLQVPVVALGGTYTAPPTPTGTFDLRLPVPVVALSGVVRPQGTLAAVLPRPTLALAGSYTAPPHPLGSFDMVLPVPALDLAGTYIGPVPTDTSNAFDGLDLAGLGIVSVTTAIAPPPAVSTTYRVDKAVPLPLPVLVKGRPT